MKKIILFALMVFTISTYSQKKENGTIYNDHPAINTVLSMNKALNDGDLDKVASYLADNFKVIDDIYTKGKNKKAYLNDAKWLNEKERYFSQTLAQDTYPIALEFKDGDDNDVVHVQASLHKKLVYPKSGVKVDMTMNSLYIVNKENKIKTIINYFDITKLREHWSSRTETTNGIIYNHHEYINKVRSMVHAFEFNDFDKGYSFFGKNAIFSDINIPNEKYFSIEEKKEKDKKFREEFSINSIDIRGAPVYFHYEIGPKRVVQSYWDFSLTRKSDGKKIVLPIRYFHYFNDKGLITFILTYYSAKLLED